MDRPRPLATMTTAQRASCLVAAVALVAAPRRGRAEEGRNPCAGHGAPASGPLPGGNDSANPADFGAVPEACPGSDLLLRLRGGLLDASAAPGFYGTVVGDATVRARRRIGGRGWISLAVDLFTFRYVDNAGLVSTGASFGPPTVGYYRQLVDAPRWALAGYARVLLPLDTARRSGLETGAEVGGAGRWRAGGRFGVDGGLAIAAPAELTGGAGHGRLEPVALAEGWLLAAPSLAVFAGATLHTRLVPDAELVAAVPRAGLRAALPRGSWLAFLGEVPFGGSDRTTAIASLFVGWAP